LDLTEGSKPNILQTVETNAKQIKGQGLMQNLVKVQGPMTYLSLYFINGEDPNPVNIFLIFLLTILFKLLLINNLPFF